MMVALGGNAARRSCIDDSARRTDQQRLLTHRLRRCRCTFIQRARWVLFSAVPSGLLVAFTTHLSTDIAAAPFLWVIPLALFLLTFVLVFREKPFISHAAAGAHCSRC